MTATSAMKMNTVEVNIADVSCSVKESGRKDWRRSGLGPNRQHQALHPRDPRASARRDRNVAVVAHGPKGAAMLGLAAVPGLEASRQRQDLPGRTGSDRRSMAAQPLV